MQDVIRKFSPTKKILGICLGMQAIGEVFGGTLLNLPSVFHGVATTATILTPDEILFKGLPEKIEVGRYHSWVVDEKTLPPSLDITAIDETGRIMALRHKLFDVRGVQFHPESILTPGGKAMVRNWLMGCGTPCSVKGPRHSGDDKCPCHPAGTPTFYFNHNPETLKP
jgi:anthranilate synthase component 2